MRGGVRAALRQAHYDLIHAHYVFSGILAKPELCADRIHPNAEGYLELARGIATGLQWLGIKG